MKFTASQIAGILEGEVEGDASIEVSKLAKIEEGLPLLHQQLRQILLIN